MHVRARWTETLRVAGHLVAVAALCLPMFGATASPAFAASAGIEAAKQVTVAISDRQYGNIGSGVVVAQGYVLTAAHVTDAVVQQNLSRTITFEDGREFSYEIVKSGRGVDLALLKVDGLQIVSIPWGDSTAASSGDEVFALGFSLGSKKLILTKGIISAPAQTVSGRPYIQTDASINPGNSGGPLVDASGRLLGINVLKFAGVAVDNVGFAVPAEEARTFVAGTPADPGAVSGGAGSQGPAPTPSAPGASGGGRGVSGGDGGGVLSLLVLLAGGAIVYVVYSARGGRATSAALDLVPAAPVVEPAPAQSALAVSYRLNGPQGRLEGSVALPAVFGRSAESDVRLQDDEVSREHARVTSSGGGISVHDLGSRNGLLVGGQRVDSMELRPGGEFTIGQTTVRLLRLVSN